jgi:hypothetical protein
MQFLDLNVAGRGVVFGKRQPTIQQQHHLLTTHQAVCQPGAYVRQEVGAPAVELHALLPLDGEWLRDLELFAFEILRDEDGERSLSEDFRLVLLAAKNDVVAFDLTFSEPDAGRCT